MCEYLVLQSKDRWAGTPGDFNISLPKSYIYKRVQLLSIQFPVTYNVTTGNNTIYWNSSINGNLTGKISPGMYDSTTIAAAIKAAMDTAFNSEVAVSYTVTLNTTRGKLTITPSAGTISMRFASYIYQSAASLMGFSSADTASTNSVTSDLLVDLAYPRVLFFELSNFASWINSSSTASRGSFVCLVNRNGAEITVQNWGDFELTAACGSIQAFHVRVTSDGHVYNPGVDWNMLLKFYN